MFKNKKSITTFGLMAAAVILVIGLMAMSQPVKQTDGIPDNDTLTSSVAPSEINGAKPDVTAPEVQPSVIPTVKPTDEDKNSSDIPLTVIDDKPELPDTAYKGESTGDATADDVKAHEALDPTLKNPDKKPTATSAPVEPAKPKDKTPQSGDKNGNGEIYIPGFGWVKDEGGGGQGEKSQIDPEHSDFDKIIGH